MLYKFKYGNLDKLFNSDKASYLDFDDGSGYAFTKNYPDCIWSNKFPLMNEKDLCLICKKNEWQDAVSNKLL